MLNRAIVFLLVTLALVLISTAQLIYGRPMDGLSVAWFIAAAMVSATASVLMACTLVQPFWRKEMRTVLDSFFWTAFLVLPICVWLFGIAIWTLCWYFLGWDQSIAPR